MSEAEREQRLRAGCDALNLQLSVEQIARLQAYLGLLAKWNKVYNLTAARGLDEMLSQHLLDCLSAVPPLQRYLNGRGGNLLDVGSGAGLPGVVFAISIAGLQVDCVDSVGKKAAFIRQAAAQLALPNLQGVHDRVENLAASYRVVSSRAFASLSDFANGSSSALSGQGAWLAMKGKVPDDEMQVLPAGVEVFHVERLIVPGLDAERCIVWMRKRSRSETTTATGVT